jgi:hypothetical protein
MGRAQRNPSLAIHKRDGYRFAPPILQIYTYKSPSSGGSNQFVSDRPPSTTIAAPVT